MSLSSSGSSSSSSFSDNRKHPQSFFPLDPLRRRIPYLMLDIKKSRRWTAARFRLVQACKLSSALRSPCLNLVHLRREVESYFLSSISYPFGGLSFLPGT